MMKFKQVSLRGKSVSPSSKFYLGLIGFNLHENNYRPRFASGKVGKVMEVSGKKGIHESPASAAALHLGRAGAFVSWGVKLEMSHEVRKGRGRMGFVWRESQGLLGGGEIGALVPR